MAHDAAAIFRNHSVERIARFHVDQIRPRAENLERPQFAPVLVGHDIVRIVRPGAVVEEAIDGTTGNRTRGNGTI